MRVFVTGASGFIGSAVVQELLRAGHEVTGLARSEASAKAISAAGAKVHKGNLEDLESLRSATAASDGVIHLGFIHDFSKFKENCEIDRCAIETMSSALLGSNRPLIITSGTAVVAEGKLVTEEMTPPANSPTPRVMTEIASRAALEKGANVSVVRLPPSVHGVGDHGFVPILIHLAREKGESAYVGEGRNHWPAVHRFDAAQVYRLAFEKAVKGAWYHAVAEEGIEFKEIAQVIGRRLNVPVVGKNPEDAAQYYGWFARFAGINAPASSKKTQEALGWRPTQKGLIADVDSDYYFS